MAEKEQDNKKAEKTERQKKEELKEKLSKGYVKAHLIFEVVGKPAEFIEETLKRLITELEKEKGIEILDKKIDKAKPYEVKTESEEKPDLFSAYAETEIFAQNLNRLTQIIFDYMPSSIEVSEPNEVKINCQDVNLLLNELATKLHQYDLSNKQLVFQRNVLFSKLKDLEKK